MTDITEWIKERRRIHNKATEGPWESDGGGEIGQHWSRPEPWRNVVSTEVACMAYCYGGSAAGVENDDDAAAIVDGHNTLPAALIMIEKVLERHRPVRGETRRSPDVCAECDELIGEPGYDCGGVVDWPCPTVQDLSSAIEGAINE